MTCTISGCDKPSARGGLCWGHVKRRQKGKPLTELGERLSPKERLVKAALDLAAACDFDEILFRKLQKRLMEHARAYTKRTAQGVHKRTQTSSRG